MLIHFDASHFGSKLFCEKYLNDTLGNPLLAHASGDFLFNVLLLTICITCLARVERRFSISGCALLAIYRQVLLARRSMIFAGFNPLIDVQSQSGSLRSRSELFCGYKRNVKLLGGTHWTVQMYFGIMSGRQFEAPSAG